MDIPVGGRDRGLDRAPQGASIVGRDDTPVPAQQGVRHPQTGPRGYVQVARHGAAGVDRDHRGDHAGENIGRAEEGIGQLAERAFALARWCREYAAEEG